jgi:hypothetical protein
MTISVTDAASGPYYPNGVTVDFPFDFSVGSVGELRVLLLGTDGVEEEIDPAGYSATIAVDGEGGTVHMAAAPVYDGRPLWVSLDPTFEQEILFEDEGPFNSAVLNPLADQSARRALWLRDRILRSVQLPFGEIGPKIGAIATRLGGKILGFNAATGAMEVQGAGAFKGDPGGNAMAIGLFSQAAALSIPVGTDLVQTSGWGARGVGSATYVYDAAVDATYVAAHPRSAFVSANGRGFRLSGETISLPQLGGVDDWDGANGTNNFAALAAAYALAPVRLRLPKSPGGTGVYMEDGNALTPGANAVGVLLDPDLGVSMVVRGAASVGHSFIKGQSATRLLRTNYLFYGYQDALAPEMRKHVSELGRPASALDGQLQMPVKLSCLDATNWSIAWPAGVPATIAPTSVNALTVSWPTPPAAGFYATMFHVVPGDFIAAGLADTATYLPAICVFTDSGWIIVYQNKVGDFSTLTKGEKIGGAAAVETTSVNAVVAQNTYRFVRSMLGVVIYDQHSFGLVVNGTVIRRFRCTGNIQRAGWGGGFGSGGGFIVQSPVLFKGKKSFGIKPLKVLCLGDSTGDETVTGQSQFDFMRQYISGVGGCQIETLTNLAHSGDKISDQMAALGNIVATDYDYCLFQIGINDIQTNTALATYLGQMLTCINYCRNTLGCEPIVGLPAMFYSQPDAQAYGQDGGATTHSADGTSLRLELLRFLADNRVYANLASFENMGAVVAPLLQMKTSPWGDQIVYDNIHPTKWGTALLGLGWARVITAHATSATEEDLPAGTVEAIPLPASYFDGAGGLGLSSTPQYTVDGRTLEIAWYLSKTAVAIADGTVVGTLPPRLRPRTNVVTPLINFGAALAAVAAAPGYWTIDPTGVIKVYGVNAGAVFMSISTGWKI